MTEFEELVSRLKSAISSEDEEKKISQDLVKILSNREASVLLKQRGYIEIVLPAFTRILFADDGDAAKQCFKYFDVIVNVFRSMLPRIKRTEWWKKFEVERLAKMIPKLASKLSGVDESWVEIWKFLAKLIITEPGLSTVPLNALLSISEGAFRAGRENPAILNQAWLCWIALIEAFSRSSNIMLPSRMTNLLLKPLVACHTESQYRLKTWIRLIDVNVDTLSEDILKTVVEPLCHAMYTSDKPISHHLPDECVRTLVAILSYDKIIRTHLSDIVELFSKCVMSRPSAACIEQLTRVTIKSINSCSDDTKSYRMWKSLIEQCESESPVLAQACSTFFSDVNFHRWVDSGTIKSEDILRFMPNSGFRNKVILRSIQSMIDDESKRKKKSSPEMSWTEYAEAYLSWLERTSSPEKVPHCDYDVQAVSALVLHPIPMNNWSQSISKMWILLCETCYKRLILQPMVKPICDALAQDEVFQIQKCVDILGFLFGIDSKSFKFSVKVLETLSSSVFSMEVKQIMDVLNFLEMSASVTDMAIVIGKIMKNINDKCSELDNLNAHKIRTKIGKITRKMEQLSCSSEKEVKPKLQRTPFRQSNFLQRLAKAEEKNKTKNSYISTVFSSAEKKREDDEENTDSPLQENVVEMKTEDCKKRVVDDAENGGIVPLLPCGVLNGKDTVVAEKENVIVATASTPSPLGKLKITNARELKTSESSPTTRKPKTIAGQKTTPKKVTPSKVSYFDDDASDCVMVPPKPKTTPLTEHQMEVMSKRRADIPALYQDLSQDTQMSNNVPHVVQTVLMKEIPDSEDIVDGTPSPVVDSLITPEKTSKSDGKMGSAKKLDFNALMCTPPSKISNGVLPDLVIKEEKIDDVLDQKPDIDGNEAVCSNIDDNKSIVSEGSGSRRKRKCEPTKFSPKLTRSKKSLKTSTSDTKTLESAKPNSKIVIENGKDCEEANLTPVAASEGERRKEVKKKDDSVLGNVTPDAVRVKKKKPKLKSTHEKNEDAGLAEVSSSTVKEIEDSQAIASAVIEKNEDPEVAKAKPSAVVEKKPDPEVAKAKPSATEREKEDHELAIAKASAVDKMKEKLEVGISKASAVIEIEEDSGETEAKPSAVVEIKRDSGKSKAKPSAVEVQEDFEKARAKPSTAVDKKEDPVVKTTDNKVGPSPLHQDPAVGTASLADTPRHKMRKRKMEEASHDSAKKTKIEDDDGNQKKIPTKKKRKTFSFSANNLESWLVKTERVANSEVKQEAVRGVVSEKTVEENGDMDNSDEIVPSTQEVESAGEEDVVVVEDENIICEEEGNIICEEDGNIEEELSEEEARKESVLDKLSEESPNDDIDLIISPSKRRRRASSVFRGEGDALIRESKALDGPDESLDDDGSNRVRDKRSHRKSLHTAGGRSARMLRMAVSSSMTDDNGLHTPVRRRENVSPIRYGDNWPTGLTEDWVACAPMAGSSPCRSALKKAPGDEGTPTRQDLTTSPSYSSSKKKRVVFLDPPVTRGLIYERDSPFGSIHHADVPVGSPYPTWKGEDDPPLRLMTPRRLPTTDAPTATEAVIVSVASDEVRMLIDLKHNVPNTEQERAAFKDKHQLGEDFMTTFMQYDADLRRLLFDCFECADMVNFIDSFKISDVRSLCSLPHDVLSHVRNTTNQSLIDVLKTAIPIIPANAPPPVDTASQTSTTEIITCSTHTNTDSPSTSCKSSQADIQLPACLPTLNDLKPLLNELGTRGAINYLADSLKMVSNFDFN